MDYLDLVIISCVKYIVTKMEKLLSIDAAINMYGNENWSLQHAICTARLRIKAMVSRLMRR